MCSKIVLKLPQLFGEKFKEEQLNKTASRRVSNVNATILMRYKVLMVLSFDLFCSKIVRAASDKSVRRL